MTPRTVAVLLVTLAMVLSPIAGVAGASPGGSGESSTGPVIVEGQTATDDPTTAEPDSGSNAGEAVVTAGLRAKMAAADDGERVPVIVVLDDQPTERFGPNTAAAELRSFARQEQSGVRDVVAAAADRNEAADVRSFWVRNAIALEATPTVVRDLAARSDVARVVYDRPVRALGSESDGALGDFFDGLADEGELADSPSTQGFERATSGDRAWGVGYIGADAVQDRGVDGSGVNVSVVDTGIDGDHPALRGQVVRWHDFVANHSEPVDPAGHGTHVAGTIAGQPGREHAVGVAPDANLFGARALDANGGGSTSDIMAAFEWSANNSADIVSASLGAPPATVGSGGQVVVNESRNASRNVSVPAAPAGNTTGYQPASVFVAVAPNQSVTNRSAAMENLSVALTGPNGTTLQRHEANWAYEQGVPDTLGFWKYKPDAGTVASGNWSLSVHNANSEPVPVDYETLAVYPSNGSDEMSRFVNDLAATTNVTPIVAAGNDGLELGNRSVGSPGAAASAITVGASAEGIDDEAAFSSRGPVDYGAERRPGVDLIAPGTNVLSTVPTNQTPDGVPAYGTKRGTSMATPHVAGTAALVLDSENGSLNRSELRDRLTGTARPTPDAPPVAGAGVVDAWAAVNATADLGAEVTDPVNRTELYGGLAGAYGNYDDIPIPAVEDPDDANAGAPDLWAVERNVGRQLAVRTHDPAPNATFTLYVDTDRNDATGAQRGADEKLVVERWQTSSGLATNATTYTYNATTTAFERDDRYTDVDMVRENYVRLWTDGLFPASFDWHLVAENANGSDALPAQGEGERTVPDTVNRSVPAQAVSWDTGAAAPNAGANLTFTLTGPNDAGVLDRQVVATDAAGSANATLTLPYNTSKDWRFENFEVEISDESGNAVSEEVEAYPKEAAIHYGDPIYQGDGLEAFDRTYRAERNETLTVNVPIHRSEPDGIVPYNGTADLYVDGLDEGTVYENVTVERGVLTQAVDLSKLAPGTSSASMWVSTGDNSYQVWAGTVDIGTSADARLSPRTRTITPGGEANLSLRLTEPENGAQRPLDARGGYEVMWLTDVQVHSLGTNVSGELGAELRRAAAGDASVSFSASERRRLQQEVEASRISPRGGGGWVETDARGVGNFSVTAPDDAVLGIVAGGAVNRSASAANALVFVEDRVEGYIGQPTAPTDYGGSSLSVDGYWVNATQPSSHYEVDLTYYPEASENANVTVSLYATTGAKHTVTLDESGNAAVNLSAPTVDPDDPAGRTDQQILGVVHNRTNPDGRAVSEVDGWVDPPFAAPETPPERTTAEPTVAFANDTLRVDLRYENETGALADPTWTVIEAASPTTYGSQSDVNVSYVNPSTSTPTYNLSAPTDPTVPKRFDVSTWTGIPPGWSFGTGASTRAGGIAVQSSTPNEVVAGGQASVSLTVVDRDGRPVPNATVVWEYRTVPERSDAETTAALPRPADGGYRVGTTDAEGEVAFDVAIDDDLGGQGLRSTAYAVTDNVSVVGGYDSVFVTEEDMADLTSDLDAPDSVAPGENIPVNATFTNDGTLAAANATFDVQFHNESANAWETLDRTTRDLGAGERFTMTAAVSHNQSAYDLRARADVGENVSELDEANNVDTASVDVVEPAPDMAVSLDAPDSVAAGENVTATATFENVGDATAENATIGIGLANDSGPLKTANRTFEPGESSTLSVTVNRDVSEYEFAAVVHNNSVPGDTNTENDVAFRTVNVEGTGDANATVELGFDPENATINRNGTVTVNVTADTGNASLYGATTAVRYSTTVLNATAIEPGGFLARDGAETFANYSRIDDPNGVAEVSVSRKNTPEGVTGNGTLATLTFEVSDGVPGGTTALLEIGPGTQLSDPDGEPLGYNATAGTVAVEETNVSVGATMFDRVLNVDSAAPVDVAASAGARLDSVSVVGPAGDSATATPSGDSFGGTLNVTPTTSTWNGTAYETANVTAAATADGTTARGNVSVQVHIAGDATGDGAVNIFDAVAVGTAWNATAGSANYDPGGDLNSDGEIDTADAVLLGQNWNDTAEVPR